MYYQWDENNDPRKVFAPVAVGKTFSSLVKQMQNSHVFFSLGAVPRKTQGT